MKKYFFSLALLFSISNVFAQDSLKANLVTSKIEKSDIFPPSSQDLMKLNIFDFCKAVGVPADYNKRYEAIILPLCDAGKMMFDKKSNPYVSERKPFLAVDTMKIDGRSIDCYLYIGTGPQNETLKRNILANRHLLVKGKLSLQNAKKWKVVK